MQLKKICIGLLKRFYRIFKGHLSLSCWRYRQPYVQHLTVTINTLSFPRKDRIRRLHWQYKIVRALTCSIFNFEFPAAAHFYYTEYLLTIIFSKNYFIDPHLWKY